MKAKVLMISMLSVLFFSCDNDVADAPVVIATEAQEGNTFVDVNKRSYTEALAIAQKSIPMLEKGTGQTRGIPIHRTINQKDGIVTICSDTRITRSGNRQTDTLLYVFNFNNDEGFAVVSASRKTEGLIAITENGNYKEGDSIDNPGFSFYMKQAKTYVETAMRAEASTRGTTIKYWKVTNDTINYIEIPKKIQVSWGQGGIAGQFCPNYIAGCGPTAAVQIMSYYQHPTYFQYTYPNCDITNQLVSWNLINQHTSVYSHPSPLCSTYPDLDTTIGRIFRQVGHAAGATYHSDGSGTSTTVNNILNVLRNFGYQVSDLQNYSTNTNLISELQNNRLVFMSGYNSENSGHGWVVDGGSHLEARNIAMVSEDGINWEIYWDRIITVTYNHINWGWDGLCNGLFLDIVFNANNCFLPDTPGLSSVTGDCDFNNNKKYATVYFNN